MRISDRNYKRLPKFAEPLRDNPDRALGKALDLAEEHRRRQADAEQTP